MHHGLSNLEQATSPSWNGIVLHSCFHLIMHLWLKSKRDINYRRCVNTAHFKHFRSCANQARVWWQSTVTAAASATNAVAVFFTQTEFHITTLFTDKLIQSSRSTNDYTDTLQVLKAEPHQQNNMMSLLCAATNISSDSLLCCEVCLFFRWICPREKLYVSVMKLLTRKEVIKVYLLSFPLRFPLALR